MFRITVYLALILLSACASTPKNSLSTVKLADHSSYQLTAPPANMVGKGFLTLVKGRHGDNDYELIVQVELAKDSIVMVGTTANGVSLFELLWHQDKPAQLTQSILAKGIEVEYLLADFQLVHWPIALLNQHLTHASAIDIGGDEAQRVINSSNTNNRGQKIIEITHQPSIISFTHLLRHYQLTITILDQWNSNG